MIINDDIDILNIDGFIISQDLHNQITATALFGIKNKDASHLGHDSITWAINSDIICNGCNICDSCQGDCHSSCQGTCTSGCQGSCHSSCQGGCTSGCQGCVGCHGGCTSGCNNGCYSGCTGKCVGCHSCNECQTCVGANCNSANGECTPSVHCIGCQAGHGSCKDSCNANCYISMAGCSPCVSSHGGQQGKAIPPKIPSTLPAIKSITCSCYGCQNTVSGDNGCGNNYGYNTPVKIEILYEDGTKGYVKYDGEDIVEGGGSNNHSDTLADFVREELNLNSKQITEDTKIILQNEKLQAVEEVTWSDIRGKTSFYKEICSSNTSVVFACSNCYGYSPSGTTGPGVGQAPTPGCGQGWKHSGSGCSSLV